MWVVGQFFWKMSRETLQALRERSRWLKRQMENGKCKAHVTGLQSQKTQQAFEWTGRRSRGAICNPGVTLIPALPREMMQFTAQPGMRVSLFFLLPYWFPKFQQALVDAQTIEVCDSLQVVCKPVKARIGELITMSQRRNFFGRSNLMFSIPGN